jgi:hypothetical protein
MSVILGKLFQCGPGVTVIHNIHCDDGPSHPILSEFVDRHNRSASSQPAHGHESPDAKKHWHDA